MQERQRPGRPSHLDAEQLETIIQELETERQGGRIKGKEIQVRIQEKLGVKYHLNLISQAVPSGRHAVVIMDRASWHTTPGLEVINNVSCMFLPPASPELNPVEQVWRQLREDSLANRCFKDYDDILDSACQAWNQFAQNTDLVKSLCSREWAII